MIPLYSHTMFNILTFYLVYIKDVAILSGILSDGISGASDASTAFWWNFVHLHYRKTWSWNSWCYLRKSKAMEHSQHTMDFTMMFRKKKWAVCHGPALQLLCLGLLQLSVPQSPGPSGMSLHGSCTRNLWYFDGGDLASWLCVTLLCTYMSIYRYISIYVYIYVFIQVYLYIYIYIHKYTYDIHTHTYIYIHTHTHTHTHTDSYLYSYSHTHTYIHIYTHTHIHT